MLGALAVGLLSLTDCPSPQAVALRLASLRAAGVVAPRYELSLERGPEVVTVTARDGSGGVLARELPASAPCVELVDAAAVVLLAWEGELVPGAVPVPTLTREVAKADAPAEPGASLAVRIWASGQLWLSSSVPTWGAQGAVGVAGRHLGLQLQVLGQGRRDVLLGGGRVQWSRVSVALGPTAALQLTDGVDLSAGVALAGGPFFISGTGFDQTRSLVDWDLGLEAQAHLLLPGVWKVRPVVGVTFVAWLRRHVAQAASPDASRVLPYLEVSPVLGLSVTP